MNFLDMGFWEIALIIIVALIIWGPGKIPEIARSLGKFMNAMKKMSFDLTTQVRKEMELEEKKTSSPTDSKEKTVRKTEPTAEDKKKSEKNPQ
jgi:sec-independent protein translocase protein TatA